MSNYLVTGANGFIGAWIVKKLSSEDVGVVVFDKNPDKQRLRQIMSEEEASRPVFIEGDITDAQLISRIIEQQNITHIIHLAGLQVPTCRANPALGAAINVIGTINVFEAAKNSNGQVKKIAYASSAAVFGSSEDGHAVSENEAGGMTTHYGAFKRCNEDNARVYYLENGISSVGLRPLTVYGAGRDAGMTSDPTKAMKAAVVSRPFHIRFGGKTDFLYAADCADAFIRSALSDLDGAHVFNLHGETVHIKDIITEIESLIPSAKSMITFNDAPIPMPSYLDGSAINKALGNIQRTSLSAGVKETIEIFSLLHSEGRLNTEDLNS